MSLKLPEGSAPLTRIGRYELVAPIASGGMAKVYLARQIGAGGFRREVAIKVTHPHLREQGEWARDLIEEAKLASCIRHPNVVAVLDVDDDPNGVFLVMEYVPGDTLGGLIRRELKRGSLVPVTIAVRILLDALDGLHAAHELTDDDGKSCNVVHRDFSPQNLLVGTDGVTKLTDFGIAKASSRAGFTQSGTIKGKFGYMSPEQVRGEALDRRSDVWAAGVVAWELLAGKRLFGGEDTTAVLLRILNEPAQSPRSVRPDAPAAVSEVILAALAREHEARTSSAKELHDRIALACLVDGIKTASREDVCTYVREMTRDVLSDRSQAARAAATSGEESVSPLLDQSPGAPSDALKTSTTVVSVASGAPSVSPERARPWMIAAAIALVVGGTLTVKRLTTPRVTEAANASAVQDPTPPPPLADTTATETPSAKTSKSDDSTAATPPSLPPPIAPPHASAIPHKASSSKAAKPKSTPLTVTANATTSSVAPLRPNPYGSSTP